MSTMNISLSEPLKRFVDQQVRDEGYSGTSDYVRELIRRDRDVVKLRALLQKGLESGPPEPVDDAWFEQLRRDIRKRAAK